MTLGILVEKYSAKKNFEKALGGEKGVFDGEKYIIVNAVGHLYQLKDVEHQVEDNLKSQYKSWNLEYLPWNEKEIKWKYNKSPGKNDVIKNIVNVLSNCDEIVIATDMDPSGEGDLLAAEIILENKLDNKKISRMKFVDESEKSLKKAFKEREIIPDLKKDLRYLKALFRSKWDFLSIQFTRIATKNNSSNYVLRQGRLKSAMISMVGEAIEKINEYKEIPYYEVKFKDENGIVYTKSNSDKYENSKDVPMNHYYSSDVVIEKKEIKQSVPPKLLDLSQLSSILASRGFEASLVLSVYQKMYEDGYVSYPRTEDKTITTEQFNEMLPLINSIAKTIGIDNKLLKNMQPRKTHVKDIGAHGANRPGLKVPKDLTELNKYGKTGVEIYKLLAKNFLAMFGENYEYEHQKGYLKDFVDYVGTANIPVKMGWKQIYNNNDYEDDEFSLKGLGKIAEPFIYEGFPPKPPQPTMKWLMKQLEKNDVGTGATRTSTFIEISNKKQKFPLLEVNKGKITITNYGNISFCLLKGTKIGDVKTSEYVLKTLREIGEGKVHLAEEVLNEVSYLVKHDLEVMKNNSANLSKMNLNYPRKTFEIKEKHTFINNKGEEISFNTTWGDYKFSQEELILLEKGETIEIKNLKGKKGNYNVRGKIEKQKYKGKTFYGFKPNEFF